MATIVIHAGMPKTGSTSVQRWIAQNAAKLRDVHGVQTLVARRATAGDDSWEVRLEPYESGAVNSGPLIIGWIERGFDPSIANRFIDELASFARDHPVILVTAEALSQVFRQADEAFITGFERLAASNDVRIAYYVRPQHAALESLWRQAAFRRSATPREFVLAQSEQFHYLRTWQTVRRMAPKVAFEMRPSRADLLDRGSTLQDFIGRFLAIDEECPDVRENVWLPLQVVNVLRQAPAGLLWSGEQEHFPRRKVSALFEGLDLSESLRIRRSRAILQQYCHDRFEPENQELIRALEWNVPDFVPPAPDLGRDWEIAELNELWAPDASDAELAMFFRTLLAALS